LCRRAGCSTPAVQRRVLGPGRGVGSSRRRPPCPTARDTYSADPRRLPAPPRAKPRRPFWDRRGAAAGWVPAPMVQRQQRCRPAPPRVRGLPGLRLPAAVGRSVDHDPLQRKSEPHNALRLSAQDAAPGSTAPNLLAVDPSAPRVRYESSTSWSPRRSSQDSLSSCTGPIQRSRLGCLGLRLSRAK